MLRPTVGKGVRILKQDIDAGLVQVKSWKTIKEYWIYRKYVPDTMLVLPKHLQKGLERETRLYAIITTLDNSEHIKDDGQGNLWITGLKFTDEPVGEKTSKDLSSYLSKTGRK